MPLVVHACKKLLHHCQAQGQESQSVRQLSWADMDNVVPVEKKALNHQIFIIAHLQIVERKHLLAALGSTGSPVTKRLH
jgi:hypothetical protein